MKIQSAFIVLFGAICCLHAAETVDKRQVGTAVVADQKDHDTAESGFAEHVAASGKYFQYTHVPAKDHYEFGHKRGNEHHFIERHEKAHPHAGEFKTKVRWGDKHGGYGEHHWDYNHAGHHDDHGEESQQQPEYAAYEETKQVPNYQLQASQKNAKYVAAPGGAQRSKRQPEVADLNDDVEFINDRARSLIVSGITGKHGGNYRKAPIVERGKREGGPEVDGKDLVFRPDTGLIVDEKTGIAYRLQPVEY